jgi:hypothetical protein
MAFTMLRGEAEGKKIRLYISYIYPESGAFYGIRIIEKAREEGLFYQGEIECMTKYAKNTLIRNKKFIPALLKNCH